MDIQKEYINFIESYVGKENKFNLNKMFLAISCVVGWSGYPYRQLVITDLHKNNLYLKIEEKIIILSINREEQEIIKNKVNNLKEQNTYEKISAQESYSDDIFYFNLNDIEKFFILGDAGIMQEKFLHNKEYLEYKEIFDLIDVINEILSKYNYEFTIYR